MAKINGRTLRLSPNYRAKLKRLHEKRWLDICPKCERQNLFDDQQVALPFCDWDDVMRTANDPDSAFVLEIAGIPFTRQALQCGVILAGGEDDENSTSWSTQRVERLAEHYRQEPSPLAAASLAEAVCNWGRGGRVRGNLKKRHSHHLGHAMHAWMQAALHATSDEDAIAPASEKRPYGLPKGLAISFGSKHLRMLDPNRFAVLDAVLSEGLGYALNPKGYALFMRQFRDFHAKLSDSGWPYSLAQTESGLFMLVRQHVRSDPS